MAVDANDLPGQDPDAPPAAPAIGAPALTPEAIRNSPEYKAMERQNRELARRAGTAEANERKAREAAEAERLAAQAREEEALQTEIRDLLGEDGLSAWDEFATLSQTDPRAAARKWAELTGKLAAARETVTSDTPAPEVPVAQQQPTPQVPPPPRTLAGNAPLSSTVAPDPDEARIADREQFFVDVAKRNRIEPNRVTSRERQDGIMAYMEVGYRKAKRAIFGG